jgi:pSer/pThr/pTyr-binding forkhead associated (FHA) protein
MATEAKKEENTPEVPFKKPMLVGKIGKFPKRFKTVTATPEPEKTESQEEEITIQSDAPPEPKPVEAAKTPPYEEPPWSSLPETSSTEYVLEVLKNGSIIETVNLMSRAYWIFGRLANCDVSMQHPTISRYHAVLQYRSDQADAARTGFYIYDLESTHGTFLNKNRVKPRSYVRVQVGHMLKLGCSTRTYILNGPLEDTEEESPLSLTELKQQRQELLLQRERQKLEEEEKRKKQEERGIDWGLGE